MSKLEKLREAFFNHFKKNPFIGIEDLKVDVRQDSKEPTTVRIQVSRMYEYVPLNFEIMQIAANIMETSKIDEESRYSRNGCDTCDFGSSYSWTLICKECKLDD